MLLAATGDSVGNSSGLMYPRPLIHPDDDRISQGAFCQNYVIGAVHYNGAGKHGKGNVVALVMNGNRRKSLKGQVTQK